MQAYTTYTKDHMHVMIYDYARICTYTLKTGCHKLNGGTIVTIPALGTYLGHLANAICKFPPFGTPFCRSLTNLQKTKKKYGGPNS